MNTIICYNAEDDAVHTLERISDESLNAVLADLKEDYASFVVFTSNEPSPFVTDIRLVIPGGLN